MGRTFSSIYVEPVSDFSVENTGYELRNSMIQNLTQTRTRRPIICICRWP